MLLTESFIVVPKFRFRCIYPLEIRLLRKHNVVESVRAIAMYYRQPKVKKVYFSMVRWDWSETATRCSVSVLVMLRGIYSSREEVPQFTAERIGEISDQLFTAEDWPIVKDMTEVLTPLRKGIENFHDDNVSFHERKVQSWLLSRFVALPCTNSTLMVKK